MGGSVLLKDSLYAPGLEPFSNSSSLPDTPKYPVAISSIWVRNLGLYAPTSNHDGSLKKTDEDPRAIVVEVEFTNLAVLYRRRADNPGVTLKDSRADILRATRAKVLLHTFSLTRD